MKKIISIFTAAVLLISCKDKTKLDAERNLVLTDTAGLYKNNSSTDFRKDSSTKNEINTKNGNPGMQKSEAEKGTSNNTSVSTTEHSTKNTVNQPADKGWSKAAKGAAIGGGTGAVLGAVVSKDKGKGAVIGGIIGAGTGYVIGRSKDKKSGRVARQKARRQARKNQ